MNEWRAVKSSDSSVIRVEDGVTIAVGVGGAVITYVREGEEESRLLYVTCT